MTRYAGRLTTAFVVVAVAVNAFAQSPPAIQAERPVPELPSGYQEKKLAFAQKYMVAAANPLAVDAGLKMLARGGSATDAAIAV